MDVLDPGHSSNTRCVPLNVTSFFDHLNNLLISNNLLVTASKSITIWLGFSGGIDSRVLLELIRNYFITLHKTISDNYKIIAVHINHGINKNARLWQDHCEQVCKSLNIEFKAIDLLTKINKIDQSVGSLEADLRNGRIMVWKTLAKRGDLILLAHHLDDQVETVFLRLLRGTGLTGLTAMDPVTTIANLTIIRPLLDYSKEQIELFAQQNKLVHIQDESNFDQKFSRNFLRYTILPKLSTKWPHFREQLRSAIKHLKQADDFIEKQAQVVLNDCYCYENYFNVILANNNKFFRNNVLYIKKLLTYDFFLQTVILRTFIANQGFYPPSEDQLHKIYSDVIAAKIDKIPQLNLRQYIIRRYRDRLYVYPPNFYVNCNNVNVAPINYRKISFKCVIGNLSIYVGDAINEISLQKTKKIFQKLGIPPWKRYDYPLIFINKKLIAILGLWNNGL